MLAERPAARTASRIRCPAADRPITELGDPDSLQRVEPSSVKPPSDDAFHRHLRQIRRRRQADEEAPTDDGRREEGGFRADDSLLGRAQKESREVARRGRGEYVPRPRSVYPSDRRSSEVVPATRRVEPSLDPARPRGPRRGRTHRPPPAGTGSVVNRCGGGWSAVADAPFTPVC